MAPRAFAAHLTPGGFGPQVRPAWLQRPWEMGTRGTHDLLSRETLSELLRAGSPSSVQPPPFCLHLPALQNPNQAVHRGSCKRQNFNPLASAVPRGEERLQVTAIRIWGIILPFPLKCPGVSLGEQGNVSLTPTVDCISQFCN